MVRTVDLRLRGCRIFLPMIPLLCNTTDKLFTHALLSPSSVIWYWPKGSDAGKVTTNNADSNGRLCTLPVVLNGNVSKYVIIIICSHFSCKTKRSKEDPQLTRNVFSRCINVADFDADEVVEPVCRVGQRLIGKQVVAELDRSVSWQRGKHSQRRLINHCHVCKCRAINKLQILGTAMFANCATEPVIKKKGIDWLSKA